MTLIDLVGLKKMASRRDSKASDLMRRLHAKVFSEMKRGMSNHAHAYVWNDSVMLLAYLDKLARTPEIILREIDGLKRKLDTLAKCYAISVKGQTFPDLVFHNPTGEDRQSFGKSRTIVMRTSSYAMANCFLIEEHIGKTLKKPWYVDSRLARRIRTIQSFEKRRLKFLPGTRVRDVYVYNGYLW